MQFITLGQISDLGKLGFNIGVCVVVYTLLVYSTANKNVTSVGIRRVYTAWSLVSNYFVLFRHNVFVLNQNSPQNMWNHFEIERFLARVFKQFSILGQLYKGL